MSRKKTIILTLVMLIFSIQFQPSQNAHASSVSAYDLILATNTLRVSYGLPALIEDPIVNAVAQATAESMAANLSSWHIGDVRGRIQAAGYGGGETVWATENFAVGTSMTIDRIMQVWADPDHMRPVTNPAYCHVGAGVAQAANGSIYYVLQAAYTSGGACGEYNYTDLDTSTGEGTVSTVPQIIIPVQVATPDEDGSIYHEVKHGQSLWAIAVAYKITIADIEFWNNISKTQSLQVGERLLIPGSNTAGYATPTPVGMVVQAAPDGQGRISHIVQPYQTLIGIADAYDVTVDRILTLNNLLVDWPLQVSQELLIDPGSITPSATPRPLTPLEQLTPDSDGRYYHVVKPGETLSYIAGLYEISLASLMASNGLTASSIIQVDQQLILQVTPPATETPTPGPATETPTATSTSTPTTVVPTSTQPLPSPTSAAEEQVEPDEGLPTWVLGLGFAVIGLGLMIFVFSRRQRQD